MDEKPKKTGKRKQAHRSMPTKHLEQLTRKARALAGDTEPEDHSISSIASKLSKLQELHGQLQQSLVSDSDKLIGARLRQEIGDAQAECATVQVVSDEAFDDRIITDIFREFPWSRGKDSAAQSVESLRTLYSVGNKYICGFKELQIGVQFDTYHEGKLVESFYLVLAGQSAFESLSIHIHTIPFYVPLKEVEQQYLSSSAAMFISVMGDLLQAYVSRREQGACSCSKVTVKLGYKDLRSNLPSVTKVVAWPPPASKGKFLAFFSRDRRPKASPISLLFAESILQQVALPDAYEHLVNGLNAILTGRSRDYQRINTASPGML